MKVFRVAADSSCLIGLAQIKIFRLLKEVFAETYIPQQQTWAKGNPRLSSFVRNQDLIMR